MGIAIGLMGLGLTTLGIVLGYMWKSNGKLQTQMMSALEKIEKGQFNIAEMLFNQTKILERIGIKLGV